MQQQLLQKSQKQLILQQQRIHQQQLQQLQLHKLPQPTTTAAAPAAAALSEDLTAVEDVGIGTAVSVKAVTTTAAALRERNKVWAGERRSSARASVFNQRRNSVISETQESPEKIRDGDNMKNSFRIQFEDSELQQEQFICSSCLSAHHDIEQSFCIFCGWKVLA
jgi:hypothetical protein